MTQIQSIVITVWDQIDNCSSHNLQNPRKESITYGRNMVKMAYDSLQRNFIKLLLYGMHFPYFLICFH